MTASICHKGHTYCLPVQVMLTHHNSVHRIRIIKCQERESSGTIGFGITHDSTCIHLFARRLMAVGISEIAMLDYLAKLGEITP